MVPQGLDPDTIIQSPFSLANKIAQKEKDDTTFRQWECRSCDVRWRGSVDDSRLCWMCEQEIAVAEASALIVPKEVRNEII